MQVSLFDELLRFSCVMKHFLVKQAVYPSIEVVELRLDPTQMKGLDIISDIAVSGEYDL